jgi:hypothetical protein
MDRILPGTFIKQVRPVKQPLPESLHEAEEALQGVIRRHLGSVVTEELEQLVEADLDGFFRELLVAEKLKPGNFIHAVVRSDNYPQSSQAQRDAEELAIQELLKREGLVGVYDRKDYLRWEVQLEATRLLKCFPYAIHAPTGRPDQLHISFFNNGKPVSSLADVWR